MVRLTPDQRLALAAIDGPPRALAEAAMRVYPSCPPGVVVSAVREWLGERRTPLPWIAAPLAYVKAAKRDLDPHVRSARQACERPAWR